MKFNLKQYIRALKMSGRGHDFKNLRVSYSQTGEDRILQTIFAHQKTGIYVEVGAFEPIKHSNTYFFYQKGWRGIVVEPQPSKAELFRQLRSRDEFVGCAVGLSDGEVDFCLGEEFGSVSPSSGQHTIRVCSKRLSSVFSESSLIGEEGEIDFMSVDCEGLDLQVLKSNDWARYRPKCLVVEENPLVGTNECVSYLTSLGYQYVCQTMLSAILVLPAFWHSIRGE